MFFTKKGIFRSSYPKLQLIDIIARQPSSVYKVKATKIKGDPNALVFKKRWNYYMPFIGKTSITELRLIKDQEVINYSIQPSNSLKYIFLGQILFVFILLTNSIITADHIASLILSGLLILIILYTYSRVRSHSKYMEGWLWSLSEKF